MTHTAKTRTLRSACCLLAPLLALLSLGGCGYIVHDPIEPGEITALEAQSFAREWRASVPMSNDRLSWLFLRDDRLFIYTQNNRVGILRSSNGEGLALSQVTSARDQLHPPVVLSEHIVYPTSSTLIVHDLRGRERFIVELPALRSHAVGEGYRVFVGFDYPGSGRLGAISLLARFDRLRWELYTRGAISSTPAVYQGVVFVASEDGMVYAVTAENKEPVWSTEGHVFRVNAPVRAPLQVDDYGLYVAVTDSRFYVLDRTSGRIRWQYFAGAPLNDAPFVTDSMVYLPVPGKGVVALEKRRGEFNRQPLWTSPLIRQILGEDDTYVYVRTVDNRLAALNRRTGQPVFSTEPTDFTAFAGNPRGSTFYVARTNGEVLAVRPVLQPGQVGEPIRGGIRRD